MKLLDWFTPASALTPHGFCLLWQPGLLWTDAIADGATMLAYFSIPVALLWFVHRRQDLPHRWLAWLFGGFIVACGVTHGFAILTLWVPAYGPQAVAKAVTACLSIVTAIALWPVVPKLLALPSPAKMAKLIVEQQATAARLRESERRLLLAAEALQSSNDILEQRVAERTAELNRVNAAITRSEHRFRRVVEGAPSAMIMVNAAGRIEMVNEQAERMFGYTRAQMLGSEVEMLMPPAFRTAHPALRAGFAANPVPRAMGDAAVLFGQRQDGSHFELEIGLNPIETDEGMMVLSVVADISARVLMEAQLRQSQKMEAIGRVAAGVAHDFNNLLQALTGSLELLLDAVADQPKATEWVQVAFRAVTRGGDLTGRLLAFSRQQVLTSRAIPVAALLNEVAELVRHMFETNANERNEIVILPGPPGLAVLADAAQLEAALINLVVNARDAMASGGELRISAYEAEADPAFVKPGHYTVISVADAGCGMDEATIAQACDPFFTTKGNDGTGLGLSMVQGFARQSGGEAHIISAIGVGTTVQLWLPSATTAAIVVEPVAQPVSARGHVLLVDDSPDVLLTVGSFLLGAGLEVTRATSGDQALPLLLNGARFDLIITDLAMSGLNGLDLLTQAREIDHAIPAIIITGYHDRELLAGLANVAVLRKPFSRKELIAQVQQCIRAPVVQN